MIVSVWEQGGDKQNWPIPAFAAELPPADWCVTQCWFQPSWWAWRAIQSEQQGSDMQMYKVEIEMPSNNENAVHLYCVVSAQTLSLVAFDLQNRHQTNSETANPADNISWLYQNVSTTEWLTRAISALHIIVTSHLWYTHKQSLWTEITDVRGCRQQPLPES